MDYTDLFPYLTYQLFKFPIVAALRSSRLVKMLTYFSSATVTNLEISYAKSGSTIHYIRSLPMLLTLRRVEKDFSSCE